MEMCDQLCCKSCNEGLYGTSMGAIMYIMFYKKMYKMLWMTLSLWSERHEEESVF
jgi:hypothetical protein